MTTTRVFIVRGIAGIAVVALISIAVLAIGHRDPTPSSAQADPAMAFRIGSCTADCQVLVDSRFGLNLDATALPTGGFGAFGAEVHLDGLTFTARTCEDNVIIEPLALCLGPTIPELSQEVILGGITSLSSPAEPSTSTGLLEMAVTCTEPGSYEIVLAAWPSSLFGAQFSAVDGTDVAVQVVGTRMLTIRDPIDPDMTVVEQRDIAAALSVECLTELPTEETPDGGDGTPVSQPTTGPGALPGTGAGPSGSAAGTDTTMMLVVISLLAVGGATMLLGLTRLGARRRAE